MEQTRVIQGTEELARGELDNVTLDGGGVALDQAGGRHLLYGCYTGPVLRLPAFDRLSASWNAVVPKGTVAEVQARVLVTPLDGETAAGHLTLADWEVSAR